MNLDSLKKLYVHELKDLWSAENQVLESMPRLIDAAGDEDLKKAMAEHRNESRDQVARLEKIFEGLEFSPRGHKCKGMEGLLTEASEILDDVEDAEVRDAALITALQRVEHYEMAGYGSARAFAAKLGRYDDADLLEKSLDEEGAADKTMSRLAERRINFEAAVH